MVFDKQGFLSEKAFLLEGSMEFLSENCQEAAGQEACRANFQASVCMDHALKTLDTVISMMQLKRIFLLPLPP